MTDAHVLILATGGTIAGLSGSALKRDYRPGQVGIDALIDSVRSLAVEGELIGRQIANIGSENAGPDLWHTLHRAVMEGMADARCRGIVITHGTDTAEQTAFLLDQTLPTHKPVVLVGAMRPADAVGSDGLRNLANAIHVARRDDAAGRGVLVVMGDLVFAARDVRKARTSGVEAFRGYPRGPVATVTPTSLDWFGAPWRVGEGPRFDLPASLPRVPVLYALAGMEGDEAQELLASHPAGIVVAGFGDGTMPDSLREPLAEAARAGLPVVRASQVDEGLVDPHPDDAEAGFIAARALNPQKARILLQLLIASGTADRESGQAAFDRR